MVFFGAIRKGPVLGCQACGLRNFEAACWSLSLEICWLMNLKLSIQKQKHSNSWITLRDLGLSIKSSNSPVEKEHGDVFSVTVVILLVAYIYIKDMPCFHLGVVNQHHQNFGCLACLCVHMYFRIIFDDMSFKGLLKNPSLGLIRLRLHWNKIKTSPHHIWGARIFTLILPYPAEYQGKSAVTANRLWVYYTVSWKF